MDNLDSLKGKWTLRKVPLKRGTLLVSINEAAVPYVGNPKLGIKLGFAIPYNLPPDAGAPDPEENDDVSKLEDAICEIVAAQTTGIHVLTLTAPDAKELVFYVTEGVDVAQLHELARAKTDNYDVQCMAQRDPQWLSFQEFLPAS
ncbi:DUF695 domain-containing protein [Rubripirellula lacrimiformis]|uniref:DUF695 domain-containing protein n=1 Tax=Rubripirellula lacrimiformis TaxID=1930273 RepID=UPI001C54E5FF|nr:DUF695 domain-containing protein [Rubripirellula lacrimiformis]